MRRFLPLLLLVGCDSINTPLPERCQAIGVAVAYDDTITGRIVDENTGTLGQVSSQCGSPFKDKYGCSIPINEHDYILWYVDEPEERDHERCHALYEEKRHINGT